MSRLDEAIASVAYILDCLMTYRNIIKAGDCNSCKNKDCKWEPKPGQLVRYNCPHYKRGNPMDDYISRQALCQYALNQKDKSVTPNDIMRFPSADVAPVVRCENCIHWSDSNQCARPELSGSRWHDPKYFDTYPDDFCSYGERREE